MAATPDLGRGVAPLGRTSAQSIAAGALLRGLFYLVSLSVAQTVKHLSAMQETWVRSLGWEDPLEKGMATHSSILVCKIPWA